MNGHPLALSVILQFSAGLALAGCSADVSTALGDGPVPTRLGGAGTVDDASPLAFTFPSPLLRRESRDDFSLGDHFFNRNWVAAPASTKDTDGLGPLYNAVSCSACHAKDGRGLPVESARLLRETGEPAEVSAAGAETGSEERVHLSLLFRLSIAPTTTTPTTQADVAPDEHYGDQLQPLGIVGVPGEAQPYVQYTIEPGTFEDGEPFSLARPTYRFEAPAYGALPPNVRISPRVAPAMIGLGLLEAVDERAILEGEDPDDRDGDGISGRANWVTDAVNGQRSLGRFGWKANQPSILQQTAGAFAGDLGLTTRIFRTDPCTPHQMLCNEAPSGRGENGYELSDGTLDAVARYSGGLAVPAMRNAERDEVRRGAGLFETVGCARCHRPTFVTGAGGAFAEFAGQTIHPYSDLLLHDLGDGLADGRPDGMANGREWRTPPLWGMGLSATVNRHTRLLHDGRARSVTEAILWHGGEAEGAQARFRALSRAERSQLLAFLDAL